MYVSQIQSLIDSFLTSDVECGTLPVRIRLPRTRWEVRHVVLRQVNEREGISLVELHERIGKSVTLVGRKPQNGYKQKHFYGCEKSGENVLVLWFIHILRTVHLQRLKGIQSSNRGMWKGYHAFVNVANRTYRKGVPFLSKMVYKRVSGGEGAEPHRIKLCWAPPGRPAESWGV